MDNTKQKKKLGANAILPVSIAACKAAAISKKIPLYKHLLGIYELIFDRYETEKPEDGSTGDTLPIPLMNVINGGVHANNSLKIQEFMIRPDKPDNFKEAMRMSVTGTHLKEGYEQVVLDILEDEKIDGPLGYEPFFENGKLFVEKGSEKKAAKVLKQSRDINKVPKIVGETKEFTEYEDLEELKQKYDILATTEAVDVDGRKRGFKEALKRLTYEKIQQLKKEGAAEFMAAASAAKKEGKKKFKFGGKEYPVTIKVDIPLKGESVKKN